MFSGDREWVKFAESKLFEVDLIKIIIIPMKSSWLFGKLVSISETSFHWTYHCLTTGGKVDHVISP